MAKLLNGTELVGYIKERQAKQVRALRQTWHVFPKLAIVKSTQTSQVIDVYVRMKQRYGDDILIETVVETATEDEMPALIKRLNEDETIHGIIVQLPLADTSRTEEIINLVAREKDVDGLRADPGFDSATAEAICWLLVGYGVDLKGKKLTIVGNGRLVGAPLAKMWQLSNYDVTVLDRSSEDIAEVVRESDVVVTATGVPRLITPAMIKPGAVVVDAGTASENGAIVGDVDVAVRARDDIKITPERGGVGPLTIAALYDHVIRSAQRVAKENEEKNASS